MLDLEKWKLMIQIFKTKDLKHHVHRKSTHLIEFIIKTSWFDVCDALNHNKEINPPPHPRINLMQKKPWRESEIFLRTWVHGRKIMQFLRTWVLKKQGFSELKKTEERNWSFMFLLMKKLVVSYMESFRGRKRILLFATWHS